MEEKIEINGEVYVKKSSVESDEKRIDDWITKNKEGKIICLVRTYSAGVFYGYVDYEKDSTYFNLEVFEATHIWNWKDNALTVGDVATNGKITFAKLSAKIPVIKLNRVIEIVPMTQKAIDNFEKMERNNGN